MTTIHVILRKKGLITIPEPTYKALDLEEGDLLEIEIKKIHRKKKAK